MNNSTLRIITRESPLAMWQAEHVQDSLSRFFPELDIHILGISTEADRFLDQTLDKLGGKGAFVKELEQALLEGRADLAVHSMKDVVVTLPEGLELEVILERASPGDAFVSNRYTHLDQLPPGSVIGTSSLRRQCQLKYCYPALEIKSIRGNVGTRLQKLDAGDFDALVLATAGLSRLGLEQRITHEISHEVMLPAIGQGALGIEIRSDDQRTRDIISRLNHVDSNDCVTAERMLNKRLNGGCHAPIAAYAVKNGDQISLSALVGAVDGSSLITASTSGPAVDAGDLGDRLGQELLERGAEQLLQPYRSGNYG